MTNDYMDEIIHRIICDVECVRWQVVDCNFQMTSEQVGSLTRVQGVLTKAIELAKQNSTEKVES